MIKYNLNNINDWYFNSSDIIKVYRNGAVVFYKFDSEQGGYKVCFAVVDDITKYTDREFEDVYDKETEKWYKLNNLNQYEEYGIYASGRTSCEGSTSRLPDGYTEVEYIENTSTSYINTDLQIYSSTTNSFEVEAKLIAAKHDSQSYQNVFSCMSEDGEPYQGFTYRYQSSSLVGTSIPNGQNTFTIVNNEDSTQTVTVTSSSSQRTYTHTYPLTLFCGLNSSRNPFRWTNSRFYFCKIKMNDELVRDFVPCKRDSDDKYGMYDIVNDVFYLSPNNVDFSGGEPIAPTDCVTTYNGKLTIDDGYEYEWNGSSWVNLGEVSGSSRVPVGYTEVEYIENASTAHINTLFKPNQDTRIVTEMQTVTSTSYGRFLGAGSYDRINAMQFDYETGANGTLHVSWGTVAGWTTYSSCVGDYNKHIYDWNKNEFYRDNTLIGSVTYGNFQCTDYLAIFGNINGISENFMYGRMYTFQLYDNGTLIRDLVPCKRDSDDKYGAYDIVNDVFYLSPNNVDFSGGEEESHTTYPKYYSEKSEPLDNLTFNTLEEAQAYAKANCVYDGMKATIGTDRYYFDSTDENGWVKVTEYYIVEDVTPGGASGWTISRSETYNPDSSYYDDFDIETTSTSNSYKIAKVTIYGYDHFTYYLRSYHTYSSSYAYVMSTNIDELSTAPTSMSYSSSSAITNTYYFNRAPKSAVNLSNYRRVTYNNLDKTVEHTFYVYFYCRTYSSYVGNATILIPKEQINENWEQVTFSASSNAASSRKNLYIDGNNSISGGTEHWYYRWIIGLPAGSHSSYTNHGNYEYCPNVTSSTFTSVAGEQRQVNFTYDNTSNKTLSFRLVDESGNTLTPSDTVYYTMTCYNSCGVSSSSNVTFPRSQSVKVGGSFLFSNLSNRHYIYGYQPPTLGTRYYVDNYQSTFDITYTKLSEEAVTITYTTYDPNDSEIPAFKTDITWPYSGGTTSSTTLVSYAVPYTYSYEVSQTNDKFSADSQEYTASQAARTINFTLYPNNREFASVADLEAYGYAWEGMTAYVGTDKYVYENGEWVYKPSRLPVGYTEVEYVENQNRSYLNTQFKPNQDTRIVAKMQCVTSSQYGRYIGAGGYNSRNAIQFDYESNYNGTLHISWGTVAGWTTYSSCVGDYNVHIYDWDKNYFYRDKGESNEFSATTTYGTFQCTDNLGIFCTIQNGNPSSQYSTEYLFGRLYSLQIYDNGTLVRDLVPCIRDNDNTVGVYDIVNDVFYYPPNYASYPLIAGNPV